MSSTFTEKLAAAKPIIEWVIEKIEQYIEEASGEWSEKLGLVKDSIESVRYSWVSSYHELLAESYKEDIAWNADLKEIEHHLKSISAQAKKVGIDLWMELKKDNK